MLFRNGNLFSQPFAVSIQGYKGTCKNFNISKEAAVKNIMKEFALSEEEANEYMKKYW